MGEPLKLHAEVRDFEEGQGVTFTVYDRQTGEEAFQTGEEAFQTGAEVQDGIAETEWTYRYNGEKLDAKPRYIFEVTGNRCKKAKSGEVEISAKIKVTIKNKEDEVVSEQPCSLYLNGEVYESGETDSEGLIEYENLVPGNYQILVKSNKEE